MPDTLMALRVSPPYWLDEPGWARLLALLERYPGAVDELAFFTAYTHPPLPLAEMERRAARLAEVLPRVRARGLGAGINVLATMGHHNENLPHSLAEAWPRVTDPQGRVSMGSYCPASPELLQYVSQVYALMAQAGPDFMWIDDDVRLMGHMPVRATCFCEPCVARFNAEVGACFSRETLVAALGGPATAERDAWRDRWLAHNRQMMRNVLSTAERAVHAVDPRIQLGFMTGDRFYEGYAFAEWAEALEGPQSGPARWRPGGGFYADDAYMGLVDKAHDVGRQVSALPSRVRVIQSEIENFPYHRLRKSVQVTMLEAAAHMAAGATGPAWNILGVSPEPVEEFGPFLERAAALRPFYAQLRAAAGRAPAVGVWPAWNRDIFADHGANGEGDWLQVDARSRNHSLEALRRMYVLGELGLPIAYAREGARVAALSGPLPQAFSPGQLEEIFAGGVLMDVTALRSLEALGLEAWAGVRVLRAIEHDMAEVLASHPLNGRFAGWDRDARQSFWPQPAYRLEPLHEHGQVLAHLSDYAGQDLGPCMTAYENALGGRVVVMGYYPWHFIHNLAKSSQMKAVCQWLSRDTLPVLVESYARVVVWARQGEDGRLTLAALNASLDPQPRVELRVRTRQPAAQHWEMDGREETLAAAPDGPEHVRVTLDDVRPWSMHLLQF